MRTVLISVSATPNAARFATSALYNRPLRVDRSTGKQHNLDPSVSLRAACRPNAHRLFIESEHNVPIVVGQLQGSEES
jgi:hypothetical protein